MSISVSTVTTKSKPISPALVFKGEITNTAFTKTSLVGHTVIFKFIPKTFLLSTS